jgi:amino-acid N-acetyltransferase
LKRSTSTARALRIVSVPRVRDLESPSLHGQRHIRGLAVHGPQSRVDVHADLHTLPDPARPLALRTRAARSTDVPALEAFIAAYTADGTLLPRTHANLLHHIGDFRVVWEGQRLVGCGALQRVDRHLAEIRSVAVHPSRRGLGLGGRIVQALLRDARRLDLTRVFCLTRRVSFFAHQGLVVVPKEAFPHKVWNDCRFCPRQECCDEIAMQRVVASPATVRNGREAAGDRGARRDRRRLTTYTTPARNRSRHEPPRPRRGSRT